MRPLSERGRLEVHRLAEQAAERGTRPEIIWHSGKLRARQTAEAFWKRCNPLATFSASRGLQPTDPTGWIIDVMAGETRDILLTGHFPHLPRLLARLVTGDPDAAAGQFPMNGMIALETDGERWVECWRIGVSRDL